MLHEVRPSPNHDIRKHPLDMIVLHYTGMETGEAAIARLCDPDSRVSAHYVVEEDGHVLQLVPDTARAWHAGVGSWAGQSDINSRSIGIEIVNGGHDWPRPDGTLPPYPDAQIRAVIALCQRLIALHHIPQTRIVGHSDIAPARKADPGEHFPWARLAKAGVGLWPADASAPMRARAKGISPGDTGPAVERIQTALASIGYEVTFDGEYDAVTENAVRAFQRRFAPHAVTGAADMPCIARILTVEATYAASPG